MTAVLPVELPRELAHELPGGIPAKEVDQNSAYAVAAFLGEQVFDVLAGRRSAHQARHHLSRQVAGLLLTTRLHAAQSPDYRLRSVHACLVTAYAVEACLVVGTHDRVRALVLRVERDNGHWICTLLSPV